MIYAPLGGSWQEENNVYGMKRLCRMIAIERFSRPLRHVELLEVLLDAGADPNFTAPLGESQRHHILMQGQYLQLYAYRNFIYELIYMYRYWYAYFVHGDENCAIYSVFSLKIPYYRLSKTC